MPQAKMKDQSCQFIEIKGSASGKQSRGMGAGDHIAITKQKGLAAPGRGIVKDGHAAGKNEGSKPSTY